ncbi:hypothetical protein [Reichenbachiella ulvae]|uniref:Lipoprotein n=1 Tax=Reichenbachiella ulvae TaxID=2980104 RepID=A0ABT3CZ02_9BACT|nr:hypothetical protein [Reichenbachiella ulvae]MCV9388778.1 hypothetical protein [Reichenbachiella ulvae]
MLTLLSLVWLLSCGMEKQEKSNYQTELKIEKVNLYGEMLTCESSEPLKIVPNAQDPTPIELNNGGDFAIKYIVEKVNGELVHQAVFYERNAGEWKNLNEEHHRTPLYLDEELNWGIAMENNDEQVFEVEMTVKTAVL